MKRISWLKWATAMVLVAVSASMVHAAEDTGEKAVGGSIDIGAISTDNRDSAPDGAEESNVDIYVQPTLDLNLKGNVTALELLFAPKYRYRTDASPIQNEDEFHIDSQIGLTHMFSKRSVLRARNRFNYTDDPEVEEGNAILRRDSSYLMNRALVGINHKLTTSLAADLQVNHMIKRYDDGGVATDSDLDRIHVGGMISKILDQTLSALLVVGAESNDSEDRADLERGFDSAYAALGVNKALNPTTTINVLAGAQSAQYEDDSIDSQVAPYVRVSFRSRLTSELDLYAQASHMISAAYSYPFSSQNHTSVFGNFTWKPMRKLNLGLFLEYRLEDYDSDSVSETVPDSAFPADRSGQETTLLGKASATFSVTDRTKLTVSHLIEDVDSDVYVTFTRNATSIALTQEF